MAGERTEKTIGNRLIMPQDFTDKFLLEEYKELRAEIRQKDTSMTQLLVVGLIANVTLISGISGFYFNLYLKLGSLISPILSYFFLAPTLVLIFLLAILISHRRDIRLIGAYIQVFYDELGYGSRWETSHNLRADHEIGEAHDYVAFTFWGIFFLCLALYFFSLTLCTAHLILVNFIAPALAALVMFSYHITYKRSKEHYYRTKLSMWRAIRDAEINEQ